MLPVKLIVTAFVQTERRMFVNIYNSSGLVFSSCLSAFRFLPVRFDILRHVFFALPVSSVTLWEFSGLPNFEVPSFAA